MTIYMENYREAMWATARLHKGLPALIKIKARPPVRDVQSQRRPLLFIGMYAIPVRHCPTVVDIQTQVARRFGIPLFEMTSARRGQEVTRPRQVAMYLSKKLTPRSLPDIGRRFGGRDHTTVIHAIRQIEKLRAIDPLLDADIVALTRQMEAA